MALKFRYNFIRRVVDRIIIWMVRYDLAPDGYYLLTVKGHKSGLPRRKPIALVEEEGMRWLVAPYGEVNWVHNARAAGKVTLSQGRNSEEYTITELSSGESASILKKYVNLYGITRPYFDAKPESDITEFEREAQLHPVFKLVRGIDVGVIDKENSHVDERSYRESQ